MQITRFLIQRFLGFIYLIAFSIALQQYIPLLGEHGLLPAGFFLKEISFYEAPSLFFLNHSDSLDERVFFNRSAKANILFIAL